MYPLCGMKPFSGGNIRDQLNETYPLFDIKGAEESPENLEQHFLSLLRFCADQDHAGTGIEVINYQENTFYESVLEYVDEAGIYTYGCYITAPPELLIKLYEAGTISQIWVQDAWLSA